MYRIEKAHFPHYLDVSGLICGCLMFSDNYHEGHSLCRKTSCHNKLMGNLSFNKNANIGYEKIIEMCPMKKFFSLLYTNVFIESIDLSCNA